MGDGMKHFWRLLRRILIWTAGMGLAALICVMNFHILWNYGFWANVSSEALEGDAFRAMDFSDGGLEQIKHLADETGMELSDAASIVMLRYGFAPNKWEIDRTDAKDLLEWKTVLDTAASPAYETIRAAYRSVLADIRYFPVPDSLDPDRTAVTFADTWKEQRSYGGERLHEGTDLMGASYERGTYPVISMTDGVVEKLGWLEKGGWRVGIRAPAGGYFYYAHLYSYASGLKEGDRIKAGQLLGYMGDSGYGKEEGTVGKFPVHLHLGIYLETDRMEEMSVNPCQILAYAQKYKLTYDY